MTAISSIVPIDDLAKLVAPGAAPVTPAVSPESVSKFESLMNNQPADGSHDLADPSKNVLGGMLEKEQVKMRGVEQSMKDFMVDMPNMSTQELTARSMVLSSEMTMSGVKMTVGTSLMSSSNKSLQTLLKNQ